MARLAYEYFILSMYVRNDDGLKVNENRFTQSATVKTASRVFSFQRCNDHANIRRGRRVRAEALDENCEISHFCTLQCNYVGNGAKYEQRFYCLLIRNHIRPFRLGGLLHLVQRWGDWAGPQPAQALLAIPNVTAHPSTASVPTASRTD